MVHEPVAAETAAASAPNLQTVALYSGIAGNGQPQYNKKCQLEA
jgi:hypothetical protein